MEPIPISIVEKHGFDRHHEPVRLGIPLVKGHCFDTDQLRLKNHLGAGVPAQLRALAHWPDGSVRWVLTEARVAVAANATETLHLENLHQSARQGRQHCQQHCDALDFKVGSSLLSIDESSLSWVLTDSGGHQNHHGRILLEDSSGSPCTARVNGWQITHCGALSSELEATGWWCSSDGNQLARFECALTVGTTGQLTIDIGIHNPQRAKHPGGLWDLGDPGSIRFGALGLQITHPENRITRVALSVDGGNATRRVDVPVNLHQESSGGEQWNSRNHLTASGQIAPRFRGYRLQHSAGVVATGNRASPIAEVVLASGNSIAVSMPRFWQNFPSSLTVDQNGLTAWLFPRDKAEPYELQGGERKTQRVVLAYDQSLDSLRWTHTPLRPLIPAAHYQEARAFPWFQANPDNAPLDSLIQAGLDGPSNFFQKRETIDEYGWRNFGDLFADHETLYQEQGDNPFISHYNNQYDAVFGFSRQFASTGDERWFELLDDLARHVVDIDIYHTAEDRAEYNHGLFWHTDHYLDAHTCTHRTFTRHNNTSSTPGQLGGGPAAEHCYTSGLLYHYLLTGSKSSRAAVLGLAHWMNALHNNQDGLLAQLLAVKKQELPKLTAKLRGRTVSPHRFPFTRGTGNYINALLDAHMLEPKKNWLDIAERVIRQTIHPADDIQQRQLLDTETGWSYLILLTSIAKYLHIKTENGEHDDNRRFARDCFLHYTEWMLNSERPFLAETGDLEFANDTWTAQDIRKAMLMFLASTEDPAKANAYQNQGRKWLSYVVEKLDASPERHFTRILVILMQNYGPQHINAPDAGSSEASVSQITGAYQAPQLSLFGLVGQIAARLFRGLIHFRPSREKAWLEARLDR